MGRNVVDINGNFAYIDAKLSERVNVVSVVAMLTSLWGLKIGGPPPPYPVYSVLPTYIHSDRLRFLPAGATYRV